MGRGAGAMPVQDVHRPPFNHRQGSTGPLHGPGTPHAMVSCPGAESNGLSPSGTLVLLGWGS